MVDANDRFPDEVEPVPQEEVVRLVDAARLRVVHRHEPVRDEPDLDCLEDAADGREGPVLGLGEERPRALLRIGAGLALVRDDRVHSRTLEGLTKTPGGLEPP